MSIRKILNFIWYDDSPLSWLLNIIIAMILVKFIIFPGLGLILGTTHPLVAVVSGSMDHQGLKFDDWWDQNGDWYEERNITREEFRNYDLKNGFNRGDIIVLTTPDSASLGDILVYAKENSRDPPIIHRIVTINGDSLQTKGDNVGRIQDFETNIKENAKIGKATLRIPYLGYIKIFFVDLLWNPIIQTFK